MITKEEVYFMKKMVVSIAGIILCIFGIHMNELSVVHATSLREQAVELAASQVGYHEKSSGSGLLDFNENPGDMNYTKYHVELSVLNGQPWTATFFWWVMDSVGVPRDVYPARTTVTSEWFEDRDMFKETAGYIPQLGDYIILGDRELCGIVESVDTEAGTVTYIAGNVSDAVTRVTRELDDEYIYGYGLIDYDYVFEPDGMNIGDNYCAILLKADTRKPVRNYDDRPVLWTEVHMADFRWLFKRQTDGTYIIQSLYDGRVLEVKDGGTTRDTDVIMADVKTQNNDHQRWYVCKNDTGIRLIPKHATNFSLHIEGQNSIDGTKLKIYQHNDTASQRFSLYSIEYVGLVGITIDSGYDKTMYVKDKQILSYTLMPESASSNTILWVSSDSSVAEIDEDGVLVAKKAGFVTIVCKSTYDNSISSSVTIQVKEKSTEQEGTTEATSTTEQEEIATGNKETAEETQDVTTQELVAKVGAKIKGKQCWFSISSVKKKTVKVIGVSNQKATNIKIPATVKYQGMTYKVTTIGKNAFKNNKKIKSVIVGNNVTSIHEGAFRNCKQLKQLVIGKRVAIIGKVAFYGCGKLQVIKIKSTKLKKIGSKAFKNIDKNPTIYAPKNKIKKYQKLFEGKI